MFNAGSYMIGLAEMPAFISDAEKIFSEDEYESLVLHLARHPDAGDLIPGTGGVRKLRWQARGSGKRGGARVIYYFRDLNIPVYLLAVYAKGEKINLSASDKKQMRAYVEAIAERAVAAKLRVVSRS